MSRRSPLLLLALVIIMPRLRAQCVTVESDRILAKHLAEANPEFAFINPELEIGFSPRPGITRLIRSAEIASLARRHQLRLRNTAQDACFVREAAPSVRLRERDEMAVSRGDDVTVEVRSGTTQIQFEGKSESAGRIGDSVLIRNPSSGRLFQARINAKGKVLVQK